MKFIDLFAGIGSFRNVLEKENHECVFSSEINNHCQIVYKDNFGDEPSGDITEIDPKSIPDFDILCGGFPCQPFSISGKQKGFDDTRGTLFFNIAQIIKERNPELIILENVKNLKNHDGGNTLKVIKKTIENLGYFVNIELLNALDFGLAQNRERVFIIGTKNREFDFEKIKKVKYKNIKDILMKGEYSILDKDKYHLIDNPKRQKSGLIFRGYLDKKGFQKGVNEEKKELSRNHKQPNRIYSSNGTHPTISSSEISGRYYIYDEDEKYVRKLTIDECYKLMGYSDKFKRSKVKSEQYRQIGNAIAIPMLEGLIKELKNQNFL